MGSFGIYVIVVTFIFVIYYVVMISFDLFGTKGEKKDSVEVILSGAPVDKTDSAPVPSATVKEQGDGKYSIEGEKQPGNVSEETVEAQADTESTEATAEERTAPTPETETEQPVPTEDDIAEADIDELAAQSQAKVDGIKQEFVNATPTIQGAVYVDEFAELCREARLKADYESEQAEQLSL